MDLKEWIQQKKILRSQLNVQESYNAKKQFQIEEILFFTKSSAPNIPASMGVVFGAVELKGKLLVDITSLNNDGTMNTEVNYYDYGHGITNINSLGNINISMDKKINLGDNFQLKFNLSDFNEIVAGKYRAKIKFQGEKLEFIKGKLESSCDFEKRKLDFIVDLQLIL